ncbi:MAG TPA: endonuclease MutS2 [Dehalococcoidia bacterium]|nr:endonuclease MutS2 [Dehalococcoidia bacterium]
MTTSVKSLSTLEYDKVIARLAGMTQTARGRALALALKPSPDHGEVLHRQRLTAEGRRLREMKPNLGLGAVKDIGTLAHQASLGHALEPAELLDVQATLAQAHTVRETVDRLRVYLPYLAEISDRIGDFREITSEIGRCINQRGEVVDGASPVLAQLRRESRVAHDRLTARLNQLLTSSRSAIQEPIVTLRDGRYVIPVKSELRAQLPGIVHDVSSSGATVFLEPLDTVEMGNRWREMLAEEQREIARILRQLSVGVGTRDSEITQALEALAEVDISLAKARLGEAIGAKEIPHDGHDQPWLLDKPSSLILENARHPLLTGDVVPITAWLGSLSTLNSQLSTTAQPFTVLLITGPNTGGKTVALKTVGLLSLMAQAGLPVPADANSRLPVFDAAYADIGDEQSIEQSLSTFSSHVGNIISILGSATEDSLVLLDELGAGTDPDEGAALAKAILTRLLEIDCLTVATTHHGELKAFAHTTPGVVNASVEFDVETLSPTYRLHIGLPGQSNALAIAQRLGMPDSILEEARAGIDPDRLAVESLITDLHREREVAQTASAEQRVAAREAEKARQSVTRELQSLEANRDRLIERTQREMEAELSEMRKRLREAVRELESAERLTVFERAKAVETAREETAEAETSVKRVAQRKQRRRRAPLPAIAVGDQIFLLDVPTPGEAISPPDERGDLDVKLGALRARINLRQIERVEKGEIGKEDGRGFAGPVASSLPLPATPPQLDLRGLTVDEALRLIDQRLDEAARAGVGELRIIHGKGTGTLRRAVREMLSKHALVQTHAAAAPRAGGDGVTVVELAV